jgi:hypothetical protein
MPVFLQTADLLGILLCCLLGLVFSEFVVDGVFQIVRQILLGNIMVLKCVRILIADPVTEL